MKIVLLVLCILMNVSACATTREAHTGTPPAEDIGGEAAGEAAVETITGRVVIFGTEPGTYAGIVAEDNTHYAIYPPEKERELRSLQGKVIRFTVIFVTPEQQSLASINLRGGTVTPLEWELIR